MCSLGVEGCRYGRNVWSVHTWTFALRPFARPPSPFELLVDLLEWHLNLGFRNCRNDENVHRFQIIIFDLHPIRKVVSDGFILYTTGENKPRPTNHDCVPAQDKMNNYPWFLPSLSLYLLSCLSSNDSGINWSHTQHQLYYLQSTIDRPTLGIRTPEDR